MKDLQRLIDSIAYIEEGLDSELQIEEIAGVAKMSKFHFQRMFHMLTGVTVAEYIRRRRLTMAAQELLHSENKVIDVALKFGYESPESFAKAFRNVHGVSPSAVKRHSRPLKAFPRLSFHIQIRGDQEMEYKLVKTEAFSVVGKGIRTSTINGQNHRDIRAFWVESNKNGLVSKLDAIGRKKKVLGICMDFDQHLDEFTYFIGVEKTADENDPKLPDDWAKKTIPAATWAVFPVHGPLPEAIEKTWQRIFAEWFPSTGYEHATGPDMEVYPTGSDVEAADHYCEIWVPIVKK